MPLIAGLKKKTRRTAKRMNTFSRISHTKGLPQVIFLKPSR